MTRCASSPAITVSLTTELISLLCHVQYASFTPFLVAAVTAATDCWKRNDVKGDNSVAKLRALLELAAEFDVYMGPLHVYSSELGRGIMDVFPLYSWYHSSWDKEPDLSTAAALAKETVFNRRAHSTCF